jgi:hypothetical protein
VTEYCENNFNNLVYRQLQLSIALQCAVAPQLVITGNYATKLLPNHATYIVGVANISGQSRLGELGVN